MATAEIPRSVDRVKRTCEVCAGLERSKPEERPHFIRVEERIFALCEDHAAACVGVETVEEIRDLFKEVVGNRSYVSRRSPTDRRVFPPRPEARRGHTGRRSVDPVE